MNPKIPAELLAELRTSGTPPPWLCNLHFRHGRTTIYNATIGAHGEIVKVGDRNVFFESDIGFKPAAIEKLTRH